MPVIVRQAVPRILAVLDSPHGWVLLDDRVETRIARRSASVKMKRMSSRVLLSVATVVCCACGRESPPPASTAAPQAAVHLEATACQPATAAEKTWLSPELAAFAQFAIACPVR